MNSKLTSQELKSQIEKRKTELNELVERQRSIELENRRIRSEETKKSIEKMIESRREENRLNLERKLNDIETEIDKVKNTNNQ